MKKRKLEGILLILLCVLGLGACADVPDNVKGDIKERSENKQTKETGETEAGTVKEKLVPVKEVMESTPSRWQEQAGRVIFDGIIHVPKNVEELYQWKVETVKEAYQNPEKVKEVFLKYFDNLERKTEKIPDKDYPFLDYIEYSDEEPSGVDLAGNPAPTDGISVDKTGHIGMAMFTDYWKDEEEGKRWNVMPVNGELAYVASYQADEKGNCLEGGTESYKMYDGRKMSPQDAMDYFMDTIQDFEQVMPSVDFYPDRVAVFKNEAEDCYIIESYGGIRFDGVRVDSVTLLEQDIARYGNVCRLSSQLTQVFQKGQKPPYWTVLDTCYQPVEKLVSYDWIIDFETAWERLKQHMAKEKEVVISQADLLYSVYYKPEGDTDFQWWYQLEEEPEMFASPVWRFISYQDAQASYVYYVDAVTGEVMAYSHAVL